MVAQSHGATAESTCHARRAASGNTRWRHFSFRGLQMMFHYTSLAGRPRRRKFLFSARQEASLGYCGGFCIPRFDYAVQAMMIAVQALLLLGGLVACSATTEGPAAAPTVASVTVSPASVTLQVGQSAQLVAVANDSAGNPVRGRPTAWTSSSGAVTVDNTGLVTAAVAGSAMVTATTDGHSDSAQVTVSGATSGATTLFSDDFEAGALGDPNRWQDIYGGGFSITSASAEGVPAAGGTHMLKIQPPGGAISHFVSTGTSSPYTHLRLSYSMYRVAGYGSGGLRSGLIRGSRDQWGSFGTAGTCPDDPNNPHQQEFFITVITQPANANWQLRMYNYWLDEQKYQVSPPICWGSYALGTGDNPQGTYYDLTYTPAENQWYRYVIELQLNTPGVADGWEKVWVNGVLKIEHRNVRYRNDPLTRIWAISFDVGSTTVGTAYVDDVLVESLP